MNFDRKSMEQIVDKMVVWTQGVTTGLTDFRIGSKIRTIYEAVAIVVEEMYDKTFRSLRQIVEENIYTILGFDKIPATYATGEITFSRTTIADTNYYIPAGTSVLSRATQ